MVKRQLSTAANFQKHLPTTAPPGGISVLTFLWLFSKPIDGFQRNFTHMIDAGWRLQLLIFGNDCLKQRLLAAIFILNFDFIVLIFKIVRWISTKLHTNDQLKETPTAAPPDGYFYFWFWFKCAFFKSIWWIRRCCVYFLWNKVFLLLPRNYVWCIALTALYFLLWCGALYLTFTIWIVMKKWFI